MKKFKWNEVLFIAFGLSFFISKSAFTVFYSILIINHMILFNWKNVKSLPLLDKFFIGLYPLAIGLSFFSAGQTSAALAVASEWTWPLIYFPAAYLFTHKTIFIKFIKAALLSFAIASVYAIYNFIFKYELSLYDHVANLPNRISSFWDILRWGYFCCILFPLFVNWNFQSFKKNKNEFYLSLFFSGLCMVDLILTNSRGPWLVSVIAAYIVLLLNRVKFYSYLIFFSLLFLISLTNSQMRARAQSIFDIQKTEEHMVSSDKSNTGRINMWKVALDVTKEVPFFGVGFKNTKNYLIPFLDQKGEEYKNKYTLVEFSYNEQHSSYFSILVQFGGLFFIFIYLVLVSIFIKAITSLNKQIILIYLVPALVSLFLINIFYSGLISFEAGLSFGLFALTALWSKTLQSTC